MALWGAYGMAYAVLENSEINFNPLDAVEPLASANGWAVERQGDEEIVTEVSTAVCTFRLWFAWRADCEALHFTCAFDMKVAAPRRPSIYPLLAMINERLWLGHFDMFSDEGMVVFRHAMLLRGGGGATPEQMVDLVHASLAECERYYPAFQFVLWGGKSPEEALAASILDTQGEA